MPDPSSLISAAGQSVGGQIKSIVGLIQSRKASKLLKGLQYPVETLPDEYAQNQRMAQNMASTGLPSEQYNLAMKNIQRQQVAALRSANDRRGGLAVIPGILQGTNDATLNLDAQNAAARMNNQRNLMTVNNQVASVKRDLYDKNIRQKYLRDYAYAMGLKGMGNQNMFGGLDQMLGAGTSAAGSTFGNNYGYNPSYSQFAGGD